MWQTSSPNSDVHSLAVSVLMNYFSFLVLYVMYVLAFQIKNIAMGMEGSVVKWADCTKDSWYLEHDTVLHWCEHKVESSGRTVGCKSANVAEINTWSITEGCCLC